MEKEVVNYRFDEATIDVATTISLNGGTVYLVGGAVRDMLLGVEPHDLDYCITGISEEKMVELFPKAKKQGKDFPVFIINGCEYALARAERKVGEKHTDFEILTSPELSIEDDLRRRDLTINAMAIDVLSHELIDPFDGREDLKNGTIRKVSEAFIEDPLRAYRVARFAAKMGFTVAADTIQSLMDMKGSIENLSRESVFAEFRKALLTEHPEVFFDVLKQAGLLEVHFKEIYDLIGVEQPAEYHPEGDAYNHTMEVLREVARRTPNVKVGSDEELTRFGALVHDLGKALTPRELWPHHYGHEERGEEPIRSLCQRIRAPFSFEKAGICTSKVHMNLGKYKSLKPKTKMKMFAEIAKAKSISYKGEEIIARVDSKDDSISFAEVAQEVMSMQSTPEMREKCTTEGVLDFEKLKTKIYESRIARLKEIEKAQNPTPVSLANISANCEKIIPKE